MRALGRLAAVGLLVAGAPVAAAAQTCDPDAHFLAWPEEDPVWTLCWMRPIHSSGANGSGLELRDVHYRGHLVLARAHAPILNVEYVSGCGPCYRDWSDQEVVFKADNEIFPGYAEPTRPPATVCNTGGGSDFGTFTGVAAEKYPDVLKLTTHIRAGWYRYTMKWRFHLDGRIEPSFGFSAIDHFCVGHGHTHHNYWRLDFDIDGAGGDRVFEDPGHAGGPPRPADQGTLLATEAVRTRESGTSWVVYDETSGRGFRVTPGPDDEPATPFAVADAWVLRYDPGEIDDIGVPGPTCPVRLGNFLDGEDVQGEDLVLWYRGGAFHPGGDDDCHVVGPTLRPVGSWK